MNVNLKWNVRTLFLCIIILGNTAILSGQHESFTPPPLPKLRVMESAAYESELLKIRGEILDRMNQGDFAFFPEKLHDNENIKYALTPEEQYMLYVVRDFKTEKDFDLRYNMLMYPQTIKTDRQLYSISYPYENFENHQLRNDKLLPELFKQFHFALWSMRKSGIIQDSDYQFLQIIFSDRAKNYDHLADLIEEFHETYPAENKKIVYLEQYYARTDPKAFKFGVRFGPIGSYYNKEFGDLVSDLYGMGVGFDFGYRSFLLRFDANMGGGILNRGLPYKQDVIPLGEGLNLGAISVSVGYYVDVLKYSWLMFSGGVGNSITGLPHTTQDELDFDVSFPNTRYYNAGCTFYLNLFRITSYSNKGPMRESMFLTFDVRYNNFSAEHIGMTSPVQGMTVMIGIGAFEGFKRKKLSAPNVYGY